MSFLSPSEDWAPSPNSWRWVAGLQHTVLPTSWLSHVVLCSQWIRLPDQCLHFCLLYASQGGVFPFPGSALFAWSGPCLEKIHPLSLENLYGYKYSFSCLPFLLCLSMLLLGLMFNSAFLFAPFHGSFWVCCHFKRLFPLGKSCTELAFAQIQVSGESLVPNMYFH